MKNYEIINKIIQQLEQNHINLYHSVTKEEIAKYISSITNNIDSLNTIQFDCEMLKLFHKFQDAHTTYYVPFYPVNRKLYYIEGKVFIQQDHDYQEVLMVGNMSVQDFLAHLQLMINYETQEYLWDSIRSVINNFYYYQMLQLCKNNESIEFTVNTHDKIEKNVLQKITLEDWKKSFSQNPNYAFKIIGNNILYMQYKKCVEMSTYPFSEFVKDIGKEIKEKNITNYILDLRNNHGGDSNIIRSLIPIVKENNLKGVVLINNGVFSSGRWAVADFKQNFDTPLIGEPTGGAAASYGYSKNLKVEDKHFSASIRYWDFSKIFGYTGSIQPDIYIPRTLKDIKNNKDSQLDFAIQYVTNELENTKVDQM